MKKFSLAAALAVALLAAGLAWAGNPVLDRWADEGTCARTIRDIRDAIQECNNTGNCRVINKCRAIEENAHEKFGAPADLSDWTAATVVALCSNSIAQDIPQMPTALDVLDKCDRMMEGVFAIANSLDQ